MAPRMIPRDERVTINHEFASLGEFIDEYVANVSRSGAFIRSRDPLPVGTRVNLKFTVIYDGIETIEGIGEVVRVQQRPAGMGVVFRQLTSHSKDLLSRLLARDPDTARHSPPPPPPAKPRRKPVPTP